MRSDLAIVGGGVIGAAHAVAAVRRGLSVAIVERSPRPLGASVRNFGMVWPIGQPRGPQRALALRSAALWSELAVEVGTRCDPVGSLHLAYADDEWRTLCEYAAMADPGEGLELWDAGDCTGRAPGTVEDGLRGGLFSCQERSVDPPQALESLHRWLRAAGVTILAPDLAVEVVPGRVRTAAGVRIEAERIAVCGGSDFETLFPGAFAGRFTKCRLQMMATGPQPSGFALGPMRAAGLTLLHYASFADCPSLAAVRARLDAELPEHRRLGIHVMAAQHSGGEVVIGDSHEYGLAFEPFLREAVDARILDYLGRFLRLPEPAIARRWDGVYAVRTEPAADYELPLGDGIAAVNGVGGAGMTLSMGLGERQVARWFGG
jgi:FAD dependent oxidoreductase TIGR03364